MIEASVEFVSHFKLKNNGKLFMQRLLKHEAVTFIQIIGLFIEIVKFWKIILFSDSLC